tara:strand:- start:4394 stop:5212 length:819 start_codon:yes stop_codon:yes gene_type:complete
MSETLTSDKIREYINFLDTLAEASAKVTLKSFRQPHDVANKGRKLNTDFDPVTEADKEAEQVIRTLIHQRYPEHDLVGEELGREHFGAEGWVERWSWIIDPIDGTRAFITGIPLWGTLIALNDGQQPVIGMLDQPYLKERFIGTPEGSMLNGTPIHTRACPDIGAATISTTDPIQLFATEEDRAAFERVAARATMMRNGYDCYAYAMLACGFIDIVIESGLEAYDIQALIPIVENAGGVVTTWEGGPADQGGQVVACGDTRLHTQVLDLLNG